MLQIKFKRLLITTVKICTGSVAENRAYAMAIKAYIIITVGDVRIIKAAFIKCYAKQLKPGEWIVTGNRDHYNGGEKT